MLFLINKFSGKVGKKETKKKRKARSVISPAVGLSRMIGRRAGTSRIGSRRDDSLLTRFVDAVFAFVRLAEFEVLFVLFIIIAFLIFKDLTARPEYNRILVKKPAFWPN